MLVTLTKLHRNVQIFSTILFSTFSSVVAAAPPSSFSIVIKPLVVNGSVNALDVRQTLHGDLPAIGTPLRLQAPLSVFGVKSIAERITDLNVTDALGAVPLSVEDDTAQAGYAMGYRNWQASRTVEAPVIIRYRIPTQPTAEGGGPPYGMKASGNGVAGSGAGFLLLPINTTSTTTAFSWDLSALPTGSVGVITAGPGNILVAGPPAELNTQWMLAGPAKTYSSTLARGFNAYFLGPQPFDTADMFDWAERGYAVLTRTLTYLDEPPYRLFFRGLKVPSYATGTARVTGGGALLTVGPTLGEQSLNNFKNTIFHEMTHQWVGHMEGAGPWFSEGLTTYLSATLPCREKLADVEFCADGVNAYANFYYSSRARNWSLKRIDDIGSGDESIRRVPYGRGMLYFGLLNAQLLAKSHGHRDLLDVLAPMFSARNKGVALNISVWESMLLRELGQSAVDQFKASVIDGSLTLIPPVNAFGPCLTRVTVDTIVTGSAERVDGFAWRPIAGCKQEHR